MVRDTTRDDLPADGGPVPGLVDELLGRLRRIETSLDHMRQHTVKEWYTTDEVATIVDKAPFTVREWCRHGRVKAAKRACGRGKSQEWIISRDELMRLQTDGLLAEPAPYRHVR